MISVLNKRIRQSDTFVALSDAAEFTGMPVKTMEHRLKNNNNWWENGDVIITRPIHHKAEGKSRKSKPQS